MADGLLLSPVMRNGLALGACLVVLGSFPFATLGCRRKAPEDGPLRQVVKGYLNELNARMAKGEPTAVKCAGARVAAEQLPQGDALREEVVRTCSYEAPLASAKAALDRAAALRAAGNSAASDCAEAALCVEDLGAPAARSEVAAVAARYESLCK
ncbi:MAG: hypothetical protein KIS78_09295 [Labilithrix sp.]|nr:hypothetical protein [Labilithrix sp.]